MVSDTDVYQAYNVSNGDLELQIIQFTIKHARKVVLFNVYQPTHGTFEAAIDYVTDAILAIPQIATNIFPDSWKIATVIPLPKTDNPKRHLLI